jgi:hypothetical protein
MPSAATLDGTEITPIVQTGTNKQVTTANYVSQVLNVNPVLTTQGGTNIKTYTLGDTLYASATNTLAKLAGNTTTTQKFLTQTGTGSASAAPIWKALSPSDINTQYGAFHFDYTTTTTATISQNSTADIPVVSTTGFSTSGHLIIGSEIISYTGITATSFTGISRGQHGSSNASHPSGSAVGGAQATDANTPTLLQLNTTDLSNGVTLNTSTSEISVAIAGIYNVQYSAQVFNTSTTQDLINIWFALNGVNIPSSASWNTTAARANNNVPASSIVTVNLFLSLAPTDKLTLKWLSISGDSVIITYPASTSPAYPSAPAIILTVNQVS